MRVGFDVDGVLYDFVAGMRRWFADVHGIPIENMPEPGIWAFGPLWGLTNEEFYAACNAATDAGHLGVYGEPPADARRTLDRVRDAGHQVIIVTARAFGRPAGGHMRSASELATRWWLNHHHLPYDELHVGAKDKSSVHTDVFIDDYPKNHAALEEAGVQAVLMDQPWNQDYTANVRVHSLTQYADHVLNLAESAA